MPIKKKSNHNLVKILLICGIIGIIALMIISFEPAQNVTEIVLYP